MRHEILADFDERIVEETDALQRIFAREGRERLAEILEARGGSSGGALAYGLQSPDGKQLAGNLGAPPRARGPRAGWSELKEAEDNEAPEEKPEILRALVTPLADGSILIVGDEQRRTDTALRGILSAFAWAVGATIALGVAGGLWLSAQFLRRVDAMRLAAHGIMAGDWGRRIPLTPVNDDLSALARTFNRLFDRIEKLLLANKHVSADIAHDLRKPLAHILRRLEEARRSDALPSAIRSALDVDRRDRRRARDVRRPVAHRPDRGRRPPGRVQAARSGGNRARRRRGFPARRRRRGQNARFASRWPLPMQGDRELLTQMIANLLDNALRHTPQGVRIVVAGDQLAHGVRADG